MFEYINALTNWIKRVEREITNFNANNDDKTPMPKDEFPKIKIIGDDEDNDEHSPYNSENQ